MTPMNARAKTSLAAAAAQEIPVERLFDAEATPPRSSPLLEAHIRRFLQLTAAYHQSDPVDQRRIVLKRDHSLRVLENAGVIVSAHPPAPSLWSAEPTVEEASPDLAVITRLAALYHDAGRFPQYQRHRTFHDARSENHAFLGVRELRARNVLEDTPTAGRRVLLTAVATHNKRYLPRGLAPAAAYATKVVRDADKLDIMRVMVEHFRSPDPNDPVVTLSVQDHPTAYTPTFVEEILAGGVGDYKALQWTNDFKILILGWCFRFNFSRSLDLVRDRGVAEALLRMLPEDALIGRLAATVRAALESGEAPLGDPPAPA